MIFRNLIMFLSDLFLLYLISGKLHNDNKLHCRGVGNTPYIYSSGIKNKFNYLKKYEM